jgi:hypothetical protein
MCRIYPRFLLPAYLVQLHPVGFLLPVRAAAASPAGQPAHLQEAHRHTLPDMGGI